MTKNSQTPDLTITLLKNPSLLALLVAIFLSLWAYRSFNPSVTFRQEVTLSVNTPTGPVSSSTVVEVSAWRTPVFAGAGGRYSSVEGEAIALELSGGKWLFVLMDSHEYLFQRALKKEGVIRFPSVIDDIRRVRKQRSPLSIPRNDLPTLVSFGDLAEPNSLIVVDPTDIATVFGEGYDLIDVTVNFTRDEITRGRLTEVWPCLAQAKSCVPWTRSSGHPLWQVQNAYFKRVAR